MGLFDFGNNKEKQISNLIDRIKSEHKKYEREAKKINKSIDLKVRDYNDQIPIINTIRNNEFGPQIDKLYKFLKKFGDVGTEISPFDFVTEKSRINHHNDMSHSDDHKNKSDSAYTEFGNKVGLGIANSIALGGTSSIGIVANPFLPNPLLLSPLVIGGVIDAIKKNKAKKDKIIQLSKQLEESKFEYKKDIEVRKRYCETMGDAIKIAEIYRVNIKSISRSIDETILPELGLVKSFLIAEDAKNKIISNDEITDLRPESITMYKDTPYNNHYLFVLNTFHFYKMIVEFFSKPILTRLLKDHAISEQEKENFNKQIESINTSLKLVQENSIMNEVLLNESKRSS